MVLISSVFILSGLLLLFSEFKCDFPTDFLGNYLSNEKYNKESFCSTLVCLKDSGRLIYDADHESNKTAPCDDFKTFAMGEFFKHRVPSDRYRFSGFDMDVRQQFLEKQKRMMLKPVKQDDLKMFKVIKTWFQMCINISYLIFLNAGSDF